MQLAQVSNTMFLTYFCSAIIGNDSGNDSGASEISDHVLRTAFTTLPQIDYILLVVPQGAQPPYVLQVAYARAHVYVYVSVCECVYVRIRACICLSFCLSVCLSVCLPVFVYVCLCVSV